MSRSINIISFDVPWPANYGGVIDVFYKLVALKKAGIKIHLHCFTYGRKPASRLDEVCEKVYYYERKTGVMSGLGIQPYTVQSRRSEELERNLLTNDFPILFEVLHTCYLLNDPRFSKRKKIYRHSNIEHDYYNELSKTERNYIKKAYLKIEALRLRNFESILRHADLILAVNKRDTTYFIKKYPEVRTVYLPSFHPNSSSSIKMERSEYILFHGNLTISENYDAAEWLIRNVFSKLKFRVIIAGLNPPAFLAELAGKYEHIQLKESPNEEEMILLVRNAQINVLFTPQPTGLKLKLLNALHKGRFVICNSNMLEGTDLDRNGSLIVCNSADEYLKAINHFFFKDFTDELNKERQKLLLNFDNEQNAKKLIHEVFD